MPQSPRYNWLTGHPILDALLSIWQEYRLQARPARWSEIRDHISPDVHASLIMLRYQGGMRPPTCTMIGPTAAQLLGLPPNFSGTDWADQSRPHKIATLTRTVARRKLPTRGQLTPGPNSPTTLAAVGMPLAPEADGTAADDGIVIMSVAWP
jgi:hypothetical protein